MKSVYKIICNVYILFWVLYNFHWQNVGVYFPLLENISNLFLGINLGISLVCTLMVIGKYKLNKFFKVLNILIISFVVYGMISIMADEPIYIKALGSGNRIKNATYLIAVLRTFLPIYTCFLFAKMGYLDKRKIQVWFWIFLFQAIAVYFLVRNSYGLNSIDELRTNNSAYIFVSLFPLISLFNNKIKLQYTLIVLLFVLTVLSLKRGAILIMILEIFYFFKFSLREVGKYKKIKIILSLCILITVGSAQIEQLYDDNTAFQNRIEKTLEGNVSGRDNIIGNLIDKYLNSSLFNLLFGYGADATLKIGINYAHNDWIELLINQGLLSFIIFLLFWIMFYKMWRKEAKISSSIYLLLGLLFICSFPKTIFSMWYSMTNIYVTLPLGYCLAEIDNRKYV